MSRYIFNKRRHLQIPQRQVKINKRQQNFWSKLNQYKATHLKKIEYKATIDKFKLSWSNFDKKIGTKIKIFVNIHMFSVLARILMKRIDKVDNLFDELIEENKNF